MLLEDDDVYHYRGVICCYKSESNIFTQMVDCIIQILRLNPTSILMRKGIAKLRQQSASIE
jgi:hypothetical protein